ncbi:MAG TPA: regulatory protein RecX [Candidatus Udaeobacter sp.]|nr:regulatory protein RecX [Candidatus Udaeobacter sp.]
MRVKLGRRGYDEADVEAAVARLIELGYLDDRSFAAGHVRRRSSDRGQLALSAELAARGIDRTVAGEALAALTPEGQLASAQRLAWRLAGGKPFAGYKELLDRVGPKLIRRGFPPAIARAACGRVWSGTAGTPEA